MNQLTLKVDLYEYSQVEKTCKLAAEKLGLNRDGLEADLQRLTDLLEYYRDQQLHKNKEHQRAKVQVPEGAHKLRRLNELYQSFVRQLTLLHQYQRKRDSQGRLIAQKEDLQSACDILFESILLKVDELDGPLRQFFEQLKAYVSEKGEGYEFTRFEARKATGVSKTQQHHYINKLVELEYLQQWGHANRGYRYRIAHWDNMARMRAEVKQFLHTQL